MDNLATDFAFVDTSEDLGAGGPPSGATARILERPFRQELIRGKIAQIEISARSRTDNGQPALTRLPRHAISKLTDLVVPKVRTDTLPRPIFIPLQEWEGVVTSLDTEMFVARLADQTNEANPDEEAEFPTSEVSDDDLALLRPGAVFRWTIGFLKAPSGTKRRTSQIVFRRLPQWTEREIREAEELADKLASAFDRFEHCDALTNGTASAG